jgi:multicomponent Na+:H+ antiporter subunit D
MPPLSGFFAKLPLVQAGLGAEQYAIVAVALAVGLLTLYSMTRLWAEAFWKAAPEDAPAEPPPAGSLAPLLLPIGALAAMTVAIGLGAESVFTLARGAAEQLLDREGYVRAVLGGPP